jgi:tetratricopeptide (TPR) repeat protein
MTTATATASRPGSAGLLALAAALLFASIAVQAVRDRGWEPYQPQNPLLWVRSGPLLQRLALGYDGLAADVYWMRAVVYYGGMRRADAVQRNYDALYPLLDLVTSLDAHFRVAYRFGAIFLTEAYPSGPGRADLAIRLLERGIERDSGRWEYFYDIGFVCYWSLHDYDKAAEWFLKGADRPGAPAWLKQLAGTTLAIGGNRATARRLWTELLASDMEFIRAQAELRLKQLDALDLIDRLNGMVSQFHEREQRPPRDLRELSVALRLPGIPVDIGGFAYVLDPATGRFTVDQRSPLWPLPSLQPPNTRPSP